MTHPHERALEAAARALALKALASEMKARGYNDTHASEYADEWWPAHLDRARAAVTAYLAEAGDGRLSELERENAALQKERDYAVKWGNAAVESVQEAMWRYQDALRAVFARLDHPGNADQRVQYFLRWPEVKAARAALAGSGEK